MASRGGKEKRGEEKQEKQEERVGFAMRPGHWRRDLGLA